MLLVRLVGGEMDNVAAVLIPGGGGGGGTLVFWGYKRSLSKCKNSPKALISGLKSTLIFKRKLTFSSIKTPLLLSKH